MTTRREAIAEAAAALARAGVSDPRREAHRLLADLLEESLGTVVLRGDQVLAPNAVAQFASTVTRRCAGEPAAQIAGWTEFRRLRIRVNRDVLIPRPETEGLVDLVFAHAPVGAGRVLDVGTGSGCVALALADESAGRLGSVIGVDVSRDALAVARANAVALGLPVRYFAGDLTGAIAPGSMSVVVSNPPYLTAEEHRRLDPGVRDWEPGLALGGGVDGLLPYRFLVRDAWRVLVPGGVLALEVDVSRAALVATLARDAGWSAVAVHVDLFGCDRFVTARRGPIHD